MKKWLCLAVAILVEVSASLALKAALESSGWYAVVVCGYVSAFALLTVCLRLGVAVSVAYSVWGAGGVTLTALASALLFGDNLTWVMGVGMTFILGGVITVEIGSRHPQSLESATGK